MTLHDDIRRVPLKGDRLPEGQPLTLGSTQARTPPDTLREVGLVMPTPTPRAVSLIPRGGDRRLWGWVVTGAALLTVDLALLVAALTAT